MQSDYLVLSKRVGALQTLGLGSSDFTSAELDELKAQIARDELTAREFFGLTKPA